MEQKEGALASLPASFLRQRCTCSGVSPISPQGCPLWPHIWRGGSFPGPSALRFREGKAEMPASTVVFIFPGRNKCK